MGAVFLGNGHGSRIQTADFSAGDVPHFVHGHMGVSGEKNIPVREGRRIVRAEGMAVGGVNHPIAQDEDGTVTGAVIVAEGLSDIRTYLRLQRAVSALLDVAQDRIEIIGGGFNPGGGI